LGISAKRYQNCVSQALLALGGRLHAVAAGTYCADLAPLLVRYGAGAADDAEVEVARRHLEWCRACAAQVGAQRAALRALAGLILLRLIASVPLVDAAAGAAHASRDGVATMVSRGQAGPMRRCRRRRSRWRARAGRGRCW
jgi:hypothetical protein